MSCEYRVGTKSDRTPTYLRNVGDAEGIRWDAYGLQADPLTASYDPKRLLLEHLGILSCWLQMANSFPDAHCARVGHRESLHPILLAAAGAAAFRLCVPEAVAL